MFCQINRCFNCPSYQHHSILWPCNVKLYCSFYSSCLRKRLCWWKRCCHLLSPTHSHRHFSHLRFCLTSVLLGTVCAIPLFTEFLRFILKMFLNLFIPPQGGGQRADIKTTLGKWINQDVLFIEDISYKFS